MSTTADSQVTPSRERDPQITTLAGVNYRQVSQTQGPYVLHDENGKPIGFVEVRYGTLERA